MRTLGFGRSLLASLTLLAVTVFMLGLYAQAAVAQSTIDRTAPTATIFAPTFGATVSGTVDVSAVAVDDVGVESLKFLVDGHPIAEDSTAPYSFSWDSTTVANGSHLLRVLAQDAAGNLALAVVLVTIDNTRPTALIDSKPSNPTNDNTPTFEFSSDEAGSIFECSLSTEADDFAPCDSPKTYPTQSDGLYTFKVRAIDQAGNKGETTAYSFEIDATAPVLSVTDTIMVDATSPDGAVLTYSVSATDTLDPNPKVNCNPPPGSIFPIGTTTVSCTASDAAGNSATASFDVVVKGATEQITDTKNLVTSLKLPVGINDSLQAKLNDALAAAKAGNMATTCTALSDFVSEVRALSGKKFSVSDANKLITEATRIKTVLGC